MKDLCTSSSSILVKAFYISFIITRGIITCGMCTCYSPGNLWFSVCWSKKIVGLVKYYCVCRVLECGTRCKREKKKDLPKRSYFFWHVATHWYTHKMRQESPYNCACTRAWGARVYVYTPHVYYTLLWEEKKMGIVEEKSYLIHNCSPQKWRSWQNCAAPKRMVLPCQSPVYARADPCLCTL